MDKDIHDTILNKWAKEGKILRGGFEAIQKKVFPNVTAAQAESAWFIYMAGAQHLFASIMNILDPGSEPTIKDLHYMDLISKELDEWEKEIKQRTKIPPGEDWTTGTR